MTPIDLPNMLLFASGITVPTNSVGGVVNKQELMRFLPGFPSALGLEKSCFVKTNQRGQKSCAGEACKLPDFAPTACIRRLPGPIGYFPADPCK